MTERKYLPYSPDDRSFKKLSEEQRKQLLNIEPSNASGGLMYPCSAELLDGRFLDNILIAEKQQYIGFWGAWPTDDPGKKSICISKIRTIKPSKNRIPKEISKTIMSYGETGMGYVLFWGEFTDGTKEQFMLGGVLDFLCLPKGKQLMSVSPFCRDEEISYNPAPEVHWAIYQEV